MPAGAARWARPLAVGLVGLLLAWAVIGTAMLGLAYGFGHDLALYQDATRRWLAGGAFYPAAQLAGPYDSVALDAVLYPPTALVLFVPSLLLPALLWWAIPLGVTAATVIRLRPAPWAWLLIGLALAQVESMKIVASGNPGMWVLAVIALGTRWPAASVLVLLKPSLAPFALFGIRHRSWWIALGLCALVSLAFLPMWSDWLASVLNARGAYSGLLYSAKDIPLMAVPLVAWAARSTASSASPRRPARGP